MGLQIGKNNEILLLFFFEGYYKKVYSAGWGIIFNLRLKSALRHPGESCGRHLKK
jgi:hypothetical protein